MALIAPVTEGRPNLTVGEALLILRAEKHLDKPLRTLNLTQLAQLTARSMMQSTVKEIEPPGGRAGLLRSSREPGQRCTRAECQRSAPRSW